MSDENDPYYTDAEERRQAINAILECTKYWPCTREHRVFKGLLAEITRLRADLAKANADRDEARRMCCVALMGTGVWRQPRMNLPGGSWTPQLIAKEHGWDCFDAKEDACS